MSGASYGNITLSGISSAASASRALASRFQDRASVFDYPGVVGNGAANNDTAGLQVAINDCAGKRELLFPAGFIFYIEGYLLIPANSVLRIYGKIFKAPFVTGSTQYNMLQITGSNVLIDGGNVGVIDGNLSNQGGPQPTAAAGIVCWYGTNQYVPSSGASPFEFIHITGLMIQNTENWPVSICAQDSLIENCHFNTANSSPQIYGPSVNTHFFGCISENINDDGLGIYGGGNFCSVSGCTVRNCGTGPFILTDNAATAPNINCSILNCRVYSNGDAGIFVDGGTSVTGGTTVATNILIANNLCWDNRTDGNFDIKNVVNCKISGNHSYITIYEGGQSLFLRNILQYVDVSDNVITGCATNEIVSLLDDNSTNVAVVIQNNVIFNNNSFGQSPTAIQLQCTGSSAYVTVRNNDAFGNIYALFSDLSGTPAATFEGTNSPNNSLNVKAFTQNVKIPVLTASQITAAGSTLSINGLASFLGPGLTLTETYPTSGLTVGWNVSNFEGETNFMFSRGLGTTGGFTAYSVSGTGAVDSTTPFLSVDHSGNLKTQGVMAPQAVAFASLPTASSSLSGAQLFVTDGRKPGEASGTGSGVPAVCTPTTRGGSTYGWFSMMSGAAVAN